jgi:hypothetical protein
VDQQLESRATRVERLTIDPAVMEEAIRRMHLLVTGVRERPTLHLQEMSSTVKWMSASPAHATAMLCVAVRGFSVADPEEVDWLFSALRQILVDV